MRIMYQGFRYNSANMGSKQRLLEFCLELRRRSIAHQLGKTLDVVTPSFILRGQKLERINSNILVRWEYDSNKPQPD